jgi:hypothetical protein
MQLYISDVRALCGIDFSIAMANKTIYLNGEILRCVVIPADVEYIGKFAFSSDKITSVVIEGAAEISEYAFYNCTNLVSVEMPDEVTKIGDYAFYLCGNLEMFTMPTCLTYIGDYAFYNCSKLSGIDIPSGVTYIGEFAFYGCESLGAITLPASSGDR